MPIFTALFKGGVITEVVVVTMEVIMVGMEAQGLLSITGTISTLSRI